MQIISMFKLKKQHKKEEKKKVEEDEKEPTFVDRMMEHFDNFYGLIFDVLFLLS